ncbi:MAG: 30S ribosome-binding factor RbfA [Ruminococcaceae bacterium]|jgi:ribosome-binding factor A|nr:30S ribosome-binding factor RbfA [Oscillospiraceae bacterium]
MRRSDRVGDEIKRTIADLIQNEIKDPRLPAMVSVLDVAASRDLSHAKVYISVLGDEKARKDCAAAIHSATGFIRREVGLRLRLRVTPELHFSFDDSIERGIRISRLIDEAIASDQPAATTEREKTRDEGN